MIQNSTYVHLKISDAYVCVFIWSTDKARSTGGFEDPSNKMRFPSWVSVIGKWSSDSLNPLSAIVFFESLNFISVENNDGNNRQSKHLPDTY